MIIIQSFICFGEKLQPVQYFKETVRFFAHPCCFFCRYCTYEYMYCSVQYTHFSHYRIIIEILLAHLKQIKHRWKWTCLQNSPQEGFSIIKHIISNILWPWKHTHTHANTPHQNVCKSQILPMAYSM
jgi:hypothetical protein